MPELPTHTILDNGRRYLRLRVQQRTVDGDLQYRAILEGDAAAKELSDWTTNVDEARAAFDAERARYR